MYIEVTEVQEIGLAQQALSRQLRNEYPHRRCRVVGFPAGNFEGAIRFAAPSGGDVSWWLGSMRGDQKSFRNFFGRGNPETRETVNIDLQFNFPMERFSRSFGGIFARNLESGITVLGHRGIATRGRSRVPMDTLFGGWSGHLSR